MSYVIIAKFTWQNVLQFLKSVSNPDYTNCLLVEAKKKEISHFSIINKTLIQQQNEKFKF